MAFSDKFVSLIRDPDVAIDLGSANVRIFASGKGLVADGPSVTRVRQEASPAGAHGQFSPEANEGKGHITSDVRPVRGGVVSDVESAASLVGQYLGRARRFGLGWPRAIACAPTDASGDEVAALTAAVRRAGVSALKVVPEPLAAAVGAGLDTSLPYAQAIIDFGAGVTDIAVLRSGELVCSAAVRLGCDALYPAVRRMVMRHYGVVLFAREAERLAKEVGLSHRSDEAMAASTPLGLDSLNGRVRRASVCGADVSEAIRPVANVIVETVRDAFRRLPPEMAAEVIEGGVCLTGGGARLPGMKELIAEVTSLDVKVAADPLRAVINGASQMLAVGEGTGSWDYEGAAAIPG